MSALYPLGHLLGLLAAQAEATDHPMQVSGEDDDVRDTQLGAAELRTYNKTSHDIALTVMAIAAQLRDPIPSLRAGFISHHSHEPAEGAEEYVRRGLDIGYPVRCGPYWTLAAWYPDSGTWPMVTMNGMTKPCIPVTVTAWEALAIIGQAQALEQQQREAQIAASCCPRPLSPAEIASRAEERLREVEAATPTE